MDSPGQFEMHHNRRMIYRREHLSVEEADVDLPSGGQVRGFPIVTHADGVIVAPLLTLHGRTYIMLLEQWRAAMNVKVLELPGGGLADGETPEETAVREVREEAGLEVKTLVKVGTVLPAPGWEVETQFHFLALCTPRVNGQALDKTETIRRRLTPVGEVRRLLRTRKIRDLKTKALLYDALEYLGR
jgi:ADP-ribose pyrophosphatase